MEECPDCGAIRPEWLGSFHKCPQKFERFVYKNSYGPGERRLEPHTLAEYEEGYLRTGNQFFQFGSS